MSFLLFLEKVKIFDIYIIDIVKIFGVWYGYFATLFLKFWYRSTYEIFL